MIQANMGLGGETIGRTVLGMGIIVAFFMFAMFTIINSLLEYFVVDVVLHLSNIFTPVLWIFVLFNFLTFPTFNIAIGFVQASHPLTGLTYYSIVALGEIIIVTAESLCLFLPNRPRIGIVFSIVVSFYANLASFCLGLVIGIVAGIYVGA